MNLYRKLFNLTLSFSIVLIFIRAEVLGLTYAFLFTGYENIKYVLCLSYQDIGYAIAVGLLFSLLVFLFRKHQKLSAAFYGIFIGCLVISILWALVNVQAVRILNTPLNYQLWYYADIFESDFVLNSVGTTIYIKLFGEWLLFTAILFFLAWLFGYGVRKAALSVRSTYGMRVAGIIALSLYFFLATHYVKKNVEKNDTVLPATVQNPVITFIKSVARSYSKEERFDKNYNAANFSYYNTVQKHPADSVPSSAPFKNKIKNVIVFVLESVPAEYVAGYGGKFNLTPQLQKHLPEAVVFKNIYTHNPNSANALFSILSSAYPYISFKTVVTEQPDLRWPTLPSVLKEQNYKTAFFTSTDSRYAKVDQFMSHRKIDMIADGRDIACDKGSIHSQAEGVGEGKNENCMVDAFTEWISKTGSQPFFGMLWTIQTHYPYFTYNPETRYAADPYFNRYLNAISETDAALGRLLDFLKQNALAASTLVVVVGDHGEAFGHHNQYGHGANIYEENVHVPLILINPLLFRGEEKNMVGGQLDIAPTILDILKKTPPAEWQGISLFSKARDNNTTYFFSTWSDYLYGFRRNEYKVVFNAYQNKTAVYNLLKDPNELHDISGQMTQFVDTANYQLNQWVQYQRIFSNKKLKGLQSALSK